MADDDLERLRRGDDAAFHRFFLDHHRRVYALALRLADSHEAASDLTQDVFVEAWHALSGFRGEATLTTWLHGITVRVARRSWRTEKRRHAREAVYAADPARRVSDPAVSGTTLDLDDALRELPSRMRAAVVLVCIEGYSYAEAARMMGVAEGTIKAQVHRGRQQLRERLDR